MIRPALAALAAAALAGPAAAAWAAPHAGHGTPGAGHGTPGAGHGTPGAGHGATAAAATVRMSASAFLPARVDVLAGETVRWRNDGLGPHTVTAADGGWDAGSLAPGEEHAHAFAATGTAAYLCLLHPGMRGEVGVHRLLLDRPAGPAAAGRPLVLTGRAALPAGTAVTLEADAGAGYVPAAGAVVAPDGRFAATLRPDAGATWRAQAAGETSPAIPVATEHRTVRARVRRADARAVITATVTPASAGATVVLQLRLPERFGWWPVARATLDRASRARFARRPRRTVPARVVLTADDGATPLARSPVFRLRGAGRR